MTLNFILLSMADIMPLIIWGGFIIFCKVIWYCMAQSKFLFDHMRWKYMVRHFSLRVGKSSSKLRQPLTSRQRKRRNIAYRKQSYRPKLRTVVPLPPPQLKSEAA